MPIGLARVADGDPGGVEDLEQAVELAREHNLPQVAAAYGNLASVVVPLGDLDRGFRLQASGREAAERFGLASTASWLRTEWILEDYWRAAGTRRWPVRSSSWPSPRPDRRPTRTSCAASSGAGSGWPAGTCPAPSRMPPPPSTWAGRPGSSTWHRRWRCRPACCRPPAGWSRPTGR
jgi:hypothetical protein